MWLACPCACGRPSRGELDLVGFWISNQRFLLADFCSLAVCLAVDTRQSLLAVTERHEDSWSRRPPLPLSASLPMAVPRWECGLT